MIRIRQIPGFLVVLLLISQTPAHGQEGVQPTVDEDFVKSLMILYQQGMIPPELSDSVTALFQEKVAWEREKVRISREVIRRTNRTAQIGMVIVHLAVVIGFLAALLEFFHARRLRKLGAETEVQEVKIGLEGVAVKTTLYGLLILLIASGFYLMFVRFVYPVQVVGP